MSWGYVPKGWNRCGRCDFRGHSVRTCTATVGPDGEPLPPVASKATNPATPVRQAAVPRRGIRRDSDSGKSS